MNRNYHSKDTVTCNLNSNNIWVQMEQSFLKIHGSGHL